MASRIVVNASPLILLGKIDGIHLLRSLCKDVLVPRTIIDEVQAGDAIEAALEEIENHDWITVLEDGSIPESILAWDLGPGESQVLNHALKLGDAWAILDDRSARRCAEAHGIRYLGTLGIVLACKRQSVIPEVKPLLEKLRETGMYMTDDLFSQILAKAGESEKQGT